MQSQKVITDTRRQKEKIGRKKRTRIGKQMVDRWMVGWIDTRIDRAVYVYLYLRDNRGAVMDQ